MIYKYRPVGVCSMEITIEVEGVHFLGGCAGNTQGVASLIAGMNIDEAIKRLKGIDCAGRGTSCPDQLSKALEEIKQKTA